MPLLVDLFEARRTEPLGKVAPRVFWGVAFEAKDVVPVKEVELGFEGPKTLRGVFVGGVGAVGGGALQLFLDVLEVLEVVHVGEVCCL